MDEKKKTVIEKKQETRKEEPTRSFLDFERQDLVRGILYAEILGKPVSLRRNRRY